MLNIILKIRKFILYIMLYLYDFTEIFTNGLNYNLLYVVSLLSVVSSILVITSKNPIISVLFLIGLFITIASYLMLIGLSFIGLSYLLVYVGAVSILFLFILMLINVRISELITDNYNSIPLAFMIGIFYIITYYKLLPNLTSNNSYTEYLKDKGIINLPSSTTADIYDIAINIINYPNNNLSFATSYTWDNAISEVSHITAIGNVIYTVYPLWLIITSIILLLAMVGSIIITIKQ